MLVLLSLLSWVAVPVLELQLALELPLVQLVLVPPRELVLVLVLVLVPPRELVLVVLEVLLAFLVVRVSEPHHIIYKDTFTDPV